MGKNSPTVRRILQEAKELSASDKDIYAAPSEDNLFDWHFIIRGPPCSPYETGSYHGRITLPSTYPLAPPSFRFLQETGRFEVNKEICLSISKFHVEEWLPAWGIRTALIALRTFMLTPAEGAVGGLDGVCDEIKKDIAEKSGQYCCRQCGGKRNDELLSTTAPERAELISNDNSEIPQLSFAYKSNAANQETSNQRISATQNSMSSNISVNNGYGQLPRQQSSVFTKLMWILSIVILFLVLKGWV
ncbi:ubiquitin-conjugating enzyme/RWD-like protein [Dipodascopsis uninucleata]